MELPIFNTYINFSRHHVCCFTIAPLLVLDKYTTWNIRCLQHPCFKNLCKIVQASKNSDSNAQHFLSDLLTHSWFHSMLFALPGYTFPYIVMNKCSTFWHVQLYCICKHWNKFSLQMDLERVPFDRILVELSFDSTGILVGDQVVWIGQLPHIQ
jgi:hypothetical protein